jgi:hypothetical protein
MVRGPSSPTKVLLEYVASKIKFSASEVAVTSSVPNSTFVPVDKSIVVVAVTVPDWISIPNEDRSSSLIPLNVIELEEPLSSGAKYIVVVLSKLEATISTFAVERRDDFEYPLGTLSALRISLS